MTDTKERCDFCGRIYDWGASDLITSKNVNISQPWGRIGEDSYGISGGNICRACFELERPKIIRKRRIAIILGLAICFMGIVMIIVSSGWDWRSSIIVSLGLVTVLWNIGLPDIPEVQWAQGGWKNTTIQRESDRRRFAISLLTFAGVCFTGFIVVKIGESVGNNGTVVAGWIVMLLGGFLTFGPIWDLFDEIRNRPREPKFKYPRDN